MTRIERLNTMERTNERTIKVFGVDTRISDVTVCDVTGTIWASEFHTTVEFKIPYDGQSAWSKATEVERYMSELLFKVYNVATAGAFHIVATFDKR